MKWIALSGWALVALFIMSPAQTANQQGVLPSGTITVGHCVKWVSSTAPFLIGDAGVACGAPVNLAIGQPVTGAAASMALTTDANGNIAQVNGLTAQ